MPPAPYSARTAPALQPPVPLTARPARDSSSPATDSSVVRGGERIDVDAAALWDGDGLHGDLPLQPRDHVVVPAAEAFVTVLGEINRPGVIPFQHGLTVSD